MQRWVWRGKHSFPKHSHGCCDTGEKPQHWHCLWSTTGMGCSTNLPTAWDWMDLRAMGAGCASSVLWVVLGRASKSVFLPSNTSGSLKKGFAFLVNLSLTHGWTTLLPLLPVRLCQVRWKSRRTLQRDKLQKKRVLQCFLQVCCGWESLTVSFTSPICVMGLQEVVFLHRL